MLGVYISSDFLPVWLLFSFLGCCLQSRSLGLVKSVDEFSSQVVWFVSFTKLVSS